MKTIVLDPGHGGKDPGALGPSGLQEKDVCLDVCLRIQDWIANRMKVVLTRQYDEFVELSDRAKIANVADADLFLSIHCNSSTNPARGFEVFTSPGQTAADRFATKLFSYYEQAHPDLPARKELSDGDPDKEAKFTVLTKTDMPAALFELEFIHTRAGEAWLKDSANLEKCAISLASAILDFAGIDAPTIAPTSPMRTRALDSPIRKLNEALAELLLLKGRDS